MNIEKIAAKLKPLMLDKISQWMKARDLSDPELKSLIEKQIISTAYKTFGDFHNKILLSLPPENKSNGPINLGTVIYDHEKWPFGISKAGLLQNMGVYGRSGSGKSNFCYNIILQLDNLGVPFLFFDHKRNLRDLLSQLKNKINIYTPGRSLSKFNFNPFITPPGLESSVFIDQLVDVLATAFTLGEGSKSIIQKAIFACYQQGNHCPMVRDIIEEVEKIQSAERIKGWKISALRALESLNFSNITSDKITQEEMIQKLIHENTVIELDGLGSSARAFLIPVLYQWIFQVKLGSPERERLTIAVVTDEAHHIFGRQNGRSSETLMERLFRMTRELGVCNIILDQTPGLISKVVLANCYTNIFLNLASAADQSLAASVCLLDTEDRRYFSMLPIGECICKLQGNFPHAFLLKVPHVNINKGAVTDSLLKSYFTEIRSKTTPSGRKTSIETYFARLPHLPMFVLPLNEPAFVFLKDILDYPDDGVEARYKRMGMTIGTASRLKQQLVDQGWIESQTIDLGRTRKIGLRLTKQAMDTLNLGNTAPQHGSIVHEYWKRYYEQRFSELGYHVALEVPRISGRVDVVARKDNQKIAIEVETGKSDFQRNIRQDLAAKYDKIIVVVTDKNAFEKIEKSLAQEGLIIPNRIQIELAGGFRLPS
ncbi:MAG: ATP-binding protein [Sedimentisphaerales bacterium]